MTTLAHISDLHFGTEAPAIADDLCRDLNRLSPTLVIVSGDLTQRARSKQFRAAQQFLRRLPSPQLVIPGNHDIPLFDIFRRFLAPLRRYTRFITADLNPFFRNAEIAVLGINTARSLTWKNGRISYDQMRLMQQTIGSISRPVFKIIVTHHPFIPPPDKSQGGVQLVGRAQHALRILDDCQIDLLLAGHLHHGYTGDVRTHYPAMRHSLIAAQAGTAISRRLRHTPNAYNLITLDTDTITITIKIWTPSGFQDSLQSSYRLEKPKINA